MLDLATKLRHWKKENKILCLELIARSHSDYQTADGFFQQHCPQVKCPKCGLRSPNVLATTICSRKTTQNGQNRMCGNASVLCKLVFLFFRGSWYSWSKCLVASVGRLYKWKSFREIGGQLFRVVLCKSVVCCNIWVGDPVYSDLFTSRYRWNREAFSSVSAVFDRFL